MTPVPAPAPSPALTLYEDAAAFLADVRDHLEADEADEAENGRQLDFLPRLAQQATPSAQALAGPPFLARVDDGGRILAVAYLNAFNLVVSRGAARAAAPLVDALLARGAALPAITGPREDAEAIADAWARATGAAPVHTDELVLYQLREVVWPTGVPGRMRAMADAEPDVDRVARWLWSFHHEALPHEPYSEETARAYAKERPATRMTYFWEVEGVPVAMAALARPTRRGVTVNAVYTPPEQRRRGYASALTAALSAEGLGRGKEFCVLYADARNPTTNAIYQAIGYREVGRSKCIRFLGP